MHIVTEITDRKIPCYFISPHLDDAILSAGGLISYLANKTDVHILTVFTEASSPPFTRFCRKFMQVSGYTDAYKFFRDRRNEDQKVFRTLHAKCKHLGFVDAAWRKKSGPRKARKFLGQFLPEVLYLYPRNRNFRSGRIVKEDWKLMLEIENALKNYVPSTQDKVVFAPLAIGNHVDHVIVRDVCAKMYKQAVFWSDFPYNQGKNTSQEFIEAPTTLQSRNLKMPFVGAEIRRSGSTLYIPRPNDRGIPRRRIKNSGLDFFRWDKNLKQKKNLILGYKTQIPTLFPNKTELKIVPELYYFKPTPEVLSPR